MKIVYSKYIPFKGFKAINLFGIIIIRKGSALSLAELRHEAIHTAQMKEMLYIGFYLWYIVEWLIRLFKKGNAYRKISFEHEAYYNQCVPNYLYERPRFGWLNYL